MMNSSDTEALQPGIHPVNERVSFGLLIPVLFLLSRLILIVTLPLEGLAGYGDHWNFFRLAGLGRPFIDFWVEFPPIFPWVSAGLFHLAAGREHTYQYLLVLLLSLAQTANVYLFWSIGKSMHPLESRIIRTAGYALLLLGLGYGWWYFDPLAVLFLLLAVRWILSGRPVWAGVAIALGILVKWFPVLALPALWRRLAWKPALAATGVTAGLSIGIWALLLGVSPGFTAASLRSQFSKGSWETIWALIDGNVGTGNFGPNVSHIQTDALALNAGNPAVISPWVVLIPLLALGAWLWWKARLETGAQMVAFIGLTWCLFLIWSPGYSPQWVLYLLPLVLFVLPLRLAVLMSTALLGLNLLEWPLLLSRGWFWSLPVIVPIRMLLLVMLGLEFWRPIRTPRSRPAASSAPNNRSLPLPTKGGIEG